ncbi:MAG TPA: hypothetical protein GXX75_17995 [Clostridiales bacterium]|nr:hypothetical protein [Clostridiales bacterium]
MERKNRYLYSIGMHQLFFNSASREDAIEIVQDYNENMAAALGEGLSFYEARLRLGSPNEIMLALRKENRFRKRSVYLPFVALAVVLFIWSFLALSETANNGVRSLFPLGILESIFIIISFVLVWVALRVPSLSMLLALKMRDRRERIYLLLLNLLPLCSMLLSYLGYFYIITGLDLWLLKPWRIGPVASRILNITLFINLAVMVAALYRAIRYSPYFIAAFIHTAGAIGLLLSLSRTLHTLSDLEGLHKMVLSSVLPYATGLSLALLTLILVSIFRKKGAMVWMPK